MLSSQAPGVRGRRVRSCHKDEPAPLRTQTLWEVYGPTASLSFLVFSTGASAASQCLCVSPVRRPCSILHSRFRSCLSLFCGSIRDATRAQVFTGSVAKRCLQEVNAHGGHGDIFYDPLDWDLLATDEVWGLCLPAHALCCVV